MADGKIHIETKIDNDTAASELTELQHLLEKYGQTLDDEMKAKINKVVAEYNKLGAAQDEVNAKADRQRQIIDTLVRKQKDLRAIGSTKEANSMETEITKATASLNKMAAQSDVITAKMQKMRLESTKMADNLNGTNKHSNKLTSSIKKIGTGLKGAITGFTALKSSASSVKKATDGINNSLHRGIKTLAKMAVSLFAIRGAYTLLSRASSAWLNSGVSGAKQLQSNINYLWVSFGSLLAPVIETITNLVFKLLSLLNNVTKTFFGVDFLAQGLEASTSGASSNLSDMNKSAKELKRQLAGFDEMNVLQDNTSDDTSAGGTSGGSVTPKFDTSSFDELDNFLERMKKKIEQLWKPFTSAWDKEGMNTMNSAMNALEGMKSMISSIGSSFESVWLNGTGETTITLLLLLLQDVFNLVGSIGTTFSEVWNEDNLGTEIIQLFWDSLNNILTLLHQIGLTINDVWNKYGKVCVQAFLDSAHSIGEILKTLTQGLLDVWNNGGSHLFDSIVRLGSKIIEIASVIFNQFIAPFVKWFIEMCAPAIGFVMDVLGTFIDVICDIIDWFGLLATDGDKAWEQLKNVWNLASEWFNTTVIQPISRFFSGLWEGIKSSASNAWNWIVGLFEKGGQIFNGLKDGIVNVFKTVVNTLISGINKIIAIPFNKINGLLNEIRSFSILGQKPFKGLWGKNPLPVPQIPKLAKGGIINRPTQAIIGEAGKEAVLPLQNNTDWMYDLADIINGGDSDEEKEINLYIDGERLFRWFVKMKKKKSLVTY